MTRRTGARAGAKEWGREKEEAVLDPHSIRQEVSIDTCSARVAFGRNVLFIAFRASSSLNRLKKKIILAIARSLNPSFLSATQEDISLEEYQEFRFYLLDGAERKTSLDKDDSQLPALLHYFNNRISVAVELDQSRG
jgi:hypothetical protein